MLPPSNFRLRAFILIVFVVLCPVGIASYPLPVRAQTGAPVFDAGNFIKNTITSAETHLVAASTGTTAITSQFQLLKGTSLDPIAWAVAKAALQSVVNSTVKWINSGFNGSPAFVTNLANSLQTVGDAQANSFIQQLSSNGAVKSPFQSQVASAVGTNYLQSTGSNGFFNQNPYTLNQTTQNDAAFLQGNFSQGGLDALFSAVLPQNNPYGATLLATQALNSQVAGAKNIQNTEYIAGSGFNSYRGNCQTTTTGQTMAGTATSGQTITPITNSSLTGGGGTLTTAASLPTTFTTTTGGTSGGTTSLSPNSGCQSQNIVTPGSVIANSLYKSLGSGIDTLVSAHEFDEIVNALMGQLLNQVLGTGGLSGISQASPTTGNVPYFNQTTPTTATTGTTLSGDFTTTLTAQVYGLQAFEADWTTIANAATAAENALNASTCTPNAQSIIASTITPILNESAGEIDVASSSIATLNIIAGEAPPVNPDGSPVTVTQTAQASANYSCFLSSGTLENADGSCPPADSVPVPSQSDIEYAQTQSTDSGATTSGGNTGIPESIYTELTQLTREARLCTVPGSTVTTVGGGTTVITTGGDTSGNNI
jgi:hypothetical protein